MTYLQWNVVGWHSIAVECFGLFRAAAVVALVVVGCFQWHFLALMKRTSCGALMNLLL